MKRRKKRKKLIILLAVLAAVAVVLAGIAIFIFVKLSLIQKTTINKDNIGISETFQNTGSDNPYSGYEIIALVGLDTREEAAKANSDTMILACLNHDKKTIQLVSVYRDTYLNIGEKYSKANAAYASGGPEQFLTMINTNLDLNVTQFVTTDFNALADLIDKLGGLDIEMTREELIHMNNYNVETSAVCGREYEAVELPDASEFDGDMTRTFHLTGTQAVSYARIRYTKGWDYKRTERQRIVLGLIKDKLTSSSWSTIMDVIDTVFPQITTNMSNTGILSLAKNVLSYQITDSTGFPFEKHGATIDGLDAVIPDTLESNVVELHELLFPGISYTATDTVKERSDYIIGRENGTITGSPSDSVSNESSSSDKYDEYRDYMDDLTATPTPAATEVPTATPTAEPTVEPTVVPTEVPEPSIEPTPSAEPSAVPSETPEQPTEPTPEAQEGAAA